MKDFAIFNLNLSDHKFTIKANSLNIMIIYRITFLIPLLSILETILKKI